MGAWTFLGRDTAFVSGTGLLMNYATFANQPVMEMAPRWSLRVLSWVAFVLCAYLAWNSVTGSGPTAACLGGADCYEVQSSVWSVWLGVPVAVAGLALYASLAGLSIMTGLTSVQAKRWLGGLLLFLSLSVALCGLWFTGLQWFAIGKLCLECTALHALGLAIFAVVVWGLRTQPRSPVARTIPAVGVLPPTAASSATAMLAPRVVPPSRAGASLFGNAPWGAAVGGALAVVMLLASGQLLFTPDATYQTKVALNEQVNLDAAASSDGESPADSSAITYQANRIPSELPDGGARVEQTGATANADSVTDLAPTTFTDPEPTADANTTNDAANNAIAVDGESSDSPSPAEPLRQRIVQFLNGAVTLDIYQHPHLGNPEAPKVVLEFASYDCPHCHAMHRVLQKALRRYGDQVAIVVLPYPQEMECNKEVKVASFSITGACATARMAIGVATLEPKRFAQFHDWLMAGKERPPSPTQSVQRAYNLVGRERMTEIPREKLNATIAKYIDLYTTIKSKTPDPSKVGLPLIVVGDHIMSGSQESDEKVFEAWEEHLGVHPLTAPPAFDLPTETPLLPGA